MKNTSLPMNALLGSLVLIGAGVFSMLNPKDDVEDTPPIKRSSTWDPNKPYISPYPKPRNIYREGANNALYRETSSNYSNNKGKYHYEVTISNARREWETYEQETLINGDVRLKKKSPDISEVNGTYIWDMDEYLPDADAQFNYILSNYSRMRKYKVSHSKGSRNNDADIYNDRLDEYLSDPEDEAEFPPEIFDYLDD